MFSIDELNWILITIPTFKLKAFQTPQVIRSSFIADRDYRKQSKGDNERWVWLLNATIWQITRTINSAWAFLLSQGWLCEVLNFCCFCILLKQAMLSVAALISSCLPQKGDHMTATQWLTLYPTWNSQKCKAPTAHAMATQALLCHALGLTRPPFSES